MDVPLEDLDRLQEGHKGYPTKEGRDETAQGRDIGQAQESSAQVHGRGSSTAAGPALLALQQRRLQLNQLQRTKQESAEGAVRVRVTVVAHSDLFNKSKGIAHAGPAWVLPTEFCCTGMRMSTNDL